MVHQGELENYFNTCMELVLDGAEVIEEAFYKKKRITTKCSDMDLVTETDKGVEKLIIGGLSKAFPDHKFIGEESTDETKKYIITDAPTWIIDPVDGTMNFVHSLPLTAISIGLYINKKPVMGIVHNPILNHTFSATIGQGAYFNGERIHVSGQSKLASAVICMESGTCGDPTRLQVIRKNFNTFLGNCRGLRLLGSASINMCYVAAGIVDSYVDFGIHAWDMAAGEMIIKEAGGVVVDTTGGKFDVLNRRLVAASSEQLAKDISARLVQIDLERD